MKKKSPKKRKKKDLDLGLTLKSHGPPHPSIKPKSLADYYIHSGLFERARDI